MSNQLLSLKKAFTLVEVLMVIAIIGLLAVLATFSYNNLQARARDSQRKQDLHSIQTAIQSYYEDNGAYPAWSGWCTQISSDTWPQVNEALLPYINPVPQDPVEANTNADYFYSLTNNGDNYTLYSTLENNKDQNYIPDALAADGLDCFNGSTNYHYKVTSPN